MKHIFYLPLIVSICLCVNGCTVENSYQGDILNLDDGFWSFYSSDPEAKMQDVWRIENDVLVCNGSPLGYLYSNGLYDDFVLKLEWRWPPDKEPGKGGVLIRMTGEHKIWPKSLEAQINATDAGDFWGLNGYELSGPADRTRSLDHEKFGTLTNVKKTRVLEKSAGQWNTYEIIADGDTVTLVINGTEANKATGCATNRGNICLTSEGSEIHFRNVELSLFNKR
ncbi:MAG: 3-keto-disaccharide hydrolase [Planctomycetota bacterium]